MILFSFFSLSNRTGTSKLCIRSSLWLVQGSGGVRYHLQVPGTAPESPCLNFCLGSVRFTS